MNSRNRAGPLCAATVLIATLSACHASSHPVSVPSSRTPSAVLELQHDIDAILSGPAFERTSWGVLVRSLRSSDTLYSHNAGKLMMPASNMKIVTLAAAVERLGWDYTYTTELVAIGRISDGALDGDLVAVGSGDPTIGRDGPGSGVFDAWAEQLKAAGIRQIRGRIVGDDNVFDDETLGPGWAWDYLAQGYAAGVGALQFNENVVSVTIGPGATVGARATISIAPEGSGLEIRNDVGTGATGSIASISIRRLPGSARLDLRGAIPLGPPPIGHTVSVDNPTLFFANALRLALISHGIDVQGAAVDIDELTDPPSRRDAMVLATYRSPPLSVLAIRMMKVSQNLYAETLLKTIGAAAGTATVNGGRAAVLATLQSWGVAWQDLVMADGSGLSRYNLITSGTLVAILTHADRDERVRALFEETLPIAGKDGTLEGRMKNTAAENNARAKTGAIANARALSGYVRTAEGEPLVFSILANNFENATEVIDRATDAIVVRLATFKR